MILCNVTETKSYIASKINITSYMFFTPIFFASIGIKTVITGMSQELILFTLALLIVAILSKIVGCGLGAKICGFSNMDSLAIGVGMISRGEVALIVANKGNAVGLMSTNLFGPVVIMVVVTTIITPILLKVVFSSKHAGVDSEPVQNGLADSYEELEALYTAKNPKLEEYIKEQQSKHK